MQMTFGHMSEPLTKVQKVDSTRTAQSYDFTYRYEDDSHPTAPTQVGHDHYIYKCKKIKIALSYGSELSIRFFRYILDGIDSHPDDALLSNDAVVGDLG